jgi:hypothetical protein
MILITGTGRSGTSLTAELLYRAGADFGPDACLRSADQENPQGYFEHTLANAINTQLLLGNWADTELLNRRDGDLPTRLYQTLVKAQYLLPPGDRRLERRARRHDRAIRQIAAEYEHRVIKDPRFCSTLPVWRRRGQIDAIVFCYRHPRQVAASLNRAYGAPEWVGLRAWRIRSEAFLRSAVGLPVVVVSFNRLLASTEDAVAETRRLLTVPHPKLDTTKANALVEQVINKTLFRCARDTTLSQPYCEILATLESLHARHDRPLPLQGTSLETEKLERSRW